MTIRFFIEVDDKVKKRELAMLTPGLTLKKFNLIAAQMIFFRVAFWDSLN